MVDYIDILIKTSILPSVAGMMYWLIKSMKATSEAQKSFFGLKIDGIIDDFREIKHSLQEATKSNLEQHVQITNRLVEFDKKQEEARILTIKVKELAAHNYEANRKLIDSIICSLDKLPCVLAGGVPVANCLERDKEP